MGYSPIRTQLISVPPYAATFTVSVAIAFLGDHWDQCSYGLSSLVSLIWWATSFSSPPLTPLFSTARSFYKLWERSRPLRPSAHGTSMTSDSTANSLMPSGLDWSWPTLGAFSRPPRFRKATKINRAFSVGGCVLAAVNRVWLVAQNGGRKRSRPSGKPQGVGEKEEAQRRRLGDGRPVIIYTL